MKNIIKFENNQIVFDTSALKTKQKRNVLTLIRANKLNTALTYAAVVQDSKHRDTIYELRDLRDIRKHRPKVKANRVWDMFQQFFNVSHHKGPSKIEVGKAIGIEVEFFMPRHDWEDEACGDCDYCSEDRPEDCENRSGGLEGARKYFTKLCAERKIKGINLGDDGSINCDESEEIALEARIITSIDDLSNLEAFCTLLKDVDAKVNKSCGLHIHLDMRDYERRPAQVVTRLAKALPLLKAMVPVSRIGNHYCEVDVGSEGGRDGRERRYAAINDAQAFAEHKTVEIRLHSGTINFTKISNWIKICHSVARSEGYPSSYTIEGYASKLNWSASLVSYIVSRIRKFNPKHALLGDSKELGTGDLMQLTVDTTYEESEAA